MSAKRFYCYSHFTPTEMKTRTDIPDVQGDMSVGATYVDACCLQINNICGTLGETSNNLSALATSSNINCFSGCGGGIWCYTGSAIGFKKQTAPYSMGDMAGYNHQAPTHVKDNISTGAAIPDGGGYVSVHANLCFYETDWRNVLLKTTEGIEMKISGSASACEQKTLSDLQNENGYYFDTDVYMSGAGTLNVSFNITCDDTTVAPVPTIGGHSIPVSVIYPASIGDFILSTGMTATYPTGEVCYNTVTSCVNSTNDEFTFRDLLVDTDGDGENNILKFDISISASCNAMKNWWVVSTGLALVGGGSSITICDCALPWDIGTGDTIDFKMHSDGDYT